MKSNVIGVMGGTFDPMHIGHLKIAVAAHEQFKLDKILVMPSGNPSSYKDVSQLADAKDRCNIISMTIAGFPFLELSEMEIRRPGRTYTSDTLRILKREYDLIYFIIGADSLFSIDKWHEADFVMKNCRLLAANRDDIPDDTIYQRIAYLKNFYDAAVEVIDVANLPYSSTEIRSRIKRRQSVSGMITPDAQEYILKRKLYLNN